MFGKSPVLPGYQILSTRVAKDNRSAVLCDTQVRRQLVHELPEMEELVAPSVSAEIEIGQFVIYPLSSAERQSVATTAGETVSKYSPSWSLPSKVLLVKDKQLEVVEYATGKVRKVPLTQVRKLPVDIPEPLKQLNWQHIIHHLPLRWKARCKCAPCL
eukprot:GHVQ01032158.1.p2 GENE.GHVQ01032158.1~~GHVQ01032158.1.p2  ORF type:complete len:158 (-),score=13.67 GHVQ01032158.1:68-541(-)